MFILVECLFTFTKLNSISCNVSSFYIDWVGLIQNSFICKYTFRFKDYGHIWTYLVENCEYYLKQGHYAAEKMHYNCIQQDIDDGCEILQSTQFLGYIFVHPKCERIHVQVFTH